MFTLKDYQRKTLDILHAFLAEARLRGPAEAFARVVRRYPSDRFAHTYATRWELDNVPYVCLRLPTGGGKTLLAAHSVGVAAQTFLERERPFVLWLVPTNTIRKQTAQALRMAQHPYRQALDDAFGMQNVTVFDIEDINTIRARDALDSVCIVVATMQTLRVEDTNKEKRKVYGHNENFEPHFARLPNAAPGLDRDEDGNVLFSFVNMVHQLHPLVIVDEAHKMVSGLSGEVMRRINPACVVEFTATPVEGNVLYRVYPSDLKKEEMVKLPFRLAEHGAWEEAVAAALATRARLEHIAANDPEYVRPLVLFQAEKRNQTCTVEVLKQFLLQQPGIREEEIAIATGDQRQLDGIDLFDHECRIKYIITVEALKEGWDCSFAYVFCSVANIKSDTDVEQLLGRVMRMPYAKARSQADLNMAYAHVVAPSFGIAAAGMYDCMMNMGFDGNEAAENVRQIPLPHDDGSLHDTPLGRLLPRGQVEPLVIMLDRAPNLADLPQEEVEQIHITAKAGKVEVRTTAMLPHSVEERLVDAAAPAQKAAIRRSAALHRQAVAASLPPSPAARGIPFAVPLLLVEIDGFMEPAERETFLQGVDWSPLEFLPEGAAPLAREDFTYNPETRAFEFDLEGEHMTYRVVNAPEQGVLYAPPEVADALALSRWLDRHCRADDIAQPAMMEFCRRAVDALLRDGACDLALLWRGKQVLAEAIRRKIDALREDARRKGYQQLLFAPAARVEVRFDEAQAFPTSGYAENIPRYSGPYRFNKHYFDLPRDLKASGEEFRCAQAIDAHPAVDMWIRNVPRQEGSFCLPTSSDNFYPDFVARLTDGRIALIEYKGKNLLTTDDTREKVNIGTLWAEKSGGRGVFLLVCEEVEELMPERIMNNIN